jgi:hypothetical protein
MKNTKLSLIFIIISACFLFGCKTEDDSFIEEGINGEWIWQQSGGGFGGWVLTPESQNATIKLIIDDTIYKEFVNDSLVLETSYELVISEEILIGTKEKDLIRFESGREKAILISDSELELIDQCFDCYSHRYIRN